MEASWMAVANFGFAAIVAMYMLVSIKPALQENTNALVALKTIIETMKKDGGS